MTPQYDLIGIVLNDAELSALSWKISHAGTAFYSAHRTAYRLAAAMRGQPGAADAVCGFADQHYSVAMDEMHGIGDDLGILSSLRRDEPAHIPKEGT